MLQVDQRWRYESVGIAVSRVDIFLACIFGKIAMSELLSCKINGMIVYRDRSYGRELPDTSTGIRSTV